MNGPEWLSLWYLRLNGYFTLPNFIAHGRRGPLTEVDVLGVRFPYSEEAEFDDDPALKIPNHGIDIVFVEAKTTQIDVLNGPWGKPETGALNYVLRRVGILPRAQVAKLAEDLYVKRVSTMDGITVRIICFAETIGDGLQAEGVTFIPWAEVLQFIKHRFARNARFKSEHDAWDEFGKFLWKQLMARTPPTVDEFFVAWARRH